MSRRIARRSSLAHHFASIGVYSKKHKSWSDIPNGGTVSIPNDPTNGGRVLLLLRDKEVIKLKDGVGFKPKISDIIDNPKKLKFIEIDAAWKVGQ